jgi:hypothetical protein
MLPITEFGSCYPHFGPVIDRFWVSSIFFEKKMDWAKGRIDKKKADLFLLPGILPLLGPAPTGTETIALDPTFGSFTLLEQVSH